MALPPLFRFAAVSSAHARAELLRQGATPGESQDVDLAGVAELAQHPHRQQRQLREPVRQQRRRRSADPGDVEANHLEVGIERIDERLQHLEARADPATHHERWPAGVTRSYVDAQPVPVVLGERSVPDDAAVRRHPRPLIELQTRDLAEALHQLQQRGIRTLYVEAGPTLASAFATSGLVDEYLVYLAPTLIGGPRTAIADLGVGSIDEQRRLELVGVEQLDDDVLITARPVRSEQ